MAHRLPLADIQFIADFAAFCRTKGDERYDDDDVYACALAQFGYPGLGYSGAARKAGVPRAAYDAAIWEEPYTFSALATRLEALLADSPAVVSK